MAIQNLAFPELLRYPNWGCYEGGSFSIVAGGLDAAGEYVGYAFSAPKSGSITKVHFSIDPYYGSGDVDVRLETVNDSTGLNSGTLWDTNTNYKITINATGLYSATLTESALVTQGQTLALILKADATSVPNVGIPKYNETRPSYPYSFYNFGTPGKSAVGAYAAWIEYSDGSIPNISWIRRFASEASSSLMTNDVRYGIRFQLPFDAKISGWWTQSDYSDNANNTVEIYGADGVTVEKTATVNGNIRQTGPSPCYHLFSTDFNAKARTWYRLTMRTSLNTGRLIYTAEIPDLTETTRFSGHDFITDDENLLQPVHYTYTSAAAAPTSEDDWVNDYGLIPPMSVLISEISTKGAADWLRFNRGRRAR